MDILHNIGIEAERVNWDIYYDYELTKLFGLRGLYTNISAL